MNLKCKIEFVIFKSMDLLVCLNCTYTFWFKQHNNLHKPPQHVLKKVLALIVPSHSHSTSHHKPQKSNSKKFVSKKKQIAFWKMKWNATIAYERSLDMKTSFNICITVLITCVHTTWQQLTTKMKNGCLLFSEIITFSTWILFPTLTSLHIHYLFNYWYQYWYLALILRAIIEIIRMDFWLVRILLLLNI